MTFKSCVKSIAIVGSNQRYFTSLLLSIPSPQPFKVGIRQAQMVPTSPFLWLLGCPIQVMSASAAKLRLLSAKRTHGLLGSSILAHTLRSHYCKYNLPEAETDDTLLIHWHPQCCMVFRPDQQLHWSERLNLHRCHLQLTCTHWLSSLPKLVSPATLPSKVLDSRVESATLK